MGNIRLGSNEIPGTDNLPREEAFLDATHIPREICVFWLQGRALSDNAGQKSSKMKGQAHLNVPNALQ
jgi:hypothetical protein